MQQFQAKPSFSKTFYHHAINDFSDSVLISVPMQSGSVSKHLFDKFCFFVAQTNLSSLSKSCLVDSAELNKPLVFKDMTDIEVGVVAEEVIPLVDINSGRLVGHNFVEEALVLGAAPVRPVKVIFVGPLMRWKTSIRIDWTCIGKYYFIEELSKLHRGLPKED